MVITGITSAFWRATRRLLRISIIRDIQNSGNDSFGIMKKPDPITLEETEVTNGIVIIRVNTGATVEPLVQEWPGKGDTGESLLVRREEDYLAFLNNARDVDDTALHRRSPLRPSRRSLSCWMQRKKVL